MKRNRKIYGCISMLVILCNLMSMICVFAKDTDEIIKFGFENVANNMVSSDNFNGKNGIIYGGAMLTSGISGNGLYLDGSDDSFEIERTSDFTGINKFTYLMWICPEFDKNIDETKDIITLGNAFSLKLRTSTGKLIVNLNTGIEKELVADSYVVANCQWINVAIAYDGNLLSLYVNGKNIGSVNVTGNVITSDSNLIFGGENGMKGSIDDIVFYNRCLNENDIVKVYEDIITKIVNWDNISYPLLSQYPNGIDSIPENLFKDSRIEYPIFTGFEEKNETDSIKVTSKNS